MINNKMLSVKCMILVFCATVVTTVKGHISQQVADATTEFSLDLLKKVLHDQSGNVVLSPVSVYTLLAILQQGARNISRTELNNVLHASPDETKEGYHNLTTAYNQQLGSVTLEFASRAFMSNEHSALPEFKQSLISDFHSDIDTLDFSDTSAATQHINAWVQRSTHFRILQLFEPGAIPPDTVLVLTNAVYFTSFWKHRFTGVQNRTFSPQPNEEKQVPSMHQEEYYYGGVNSELGVKWVHVDLPFGHEFTVLLLLPTERHGLDNLVNRLTAQNLTALFSDHQWKHVKLTIPKFTLGANTKLIPVLRKLGIQNIFEDSADLSGITTQSIKVSDIVQKAEIAVDEEGITASAATGIVAFPPSAEYHPEDTEELIFTADEPFLFFIVDRQNSVPLFSGRVSDPTS